MRARIAPDKQTAKLSVEKRKNGKTVTVITGLLAVANDHASLLKQFKSSCGAGGTIDGDNIEIQGEHLEKVGQELSKLGYRIRR
jgi:translation initiation factor 1